LNDPRDIRIENYHYELPASRIARFPTERRGDSKLLVFRPSGITHDTFNNIAKFLPAASVLVFNNTKVIRARLLFRNSAGKQIEVFCLEPSHGTVISQSMAAAGKVEYNCIVGNLKQWKEEELVMPLEDLTLKARILKRESGYVVACFEWTPKNVSFAEVLRKSGHIPIPPYLERPDEVVDEERYQTVYAQESGSVAAPTAGLHFTQGLLEELELAGFKRLAVTLHVGAGTFKPVKTELIGAHEMHSEWIDISLNTLHELIKDPAAPIIAVGTTSFRTLESLYWMGVKVKNDPGIHLTALQLSQWEVYSMGSSLTISESLSALAGWLVQNGLTRLVCQTQILVAPPYKAKVCSGLVTNFHQPASTLLLLVAAFTDGQWKQIYDHALQNGFRFLSYGDSSLLLRQ
jgi:S-adenosylmethionine:tRNA ribosyltransferase-isomerase